MRAILPWLVLMLGMFGSTGCSRTPERGVKMGNADFAVKEAAPQVHQEPHGRQEPVALQDQGPAGEKPAGAEKKAKVDQPRKIRYSADLRIIVEDFAKAEKDLKAAILEAGGDEAKVEINSTPNSVRTGSWRIRVPVKQLDRFREAVLKLGEAERNTLDSEDMTTLYYDLDAHIKNRLTEREAIRDLLKEVGKKDLRQYLDVKKVLDDITDDINRQEGKLRLWANLTDLTTVNVILQEKQKFVPGKPPEIAEVPTFDMRASKTFNDSWEALVNVGQGLALFGIAVAPWLPPLLVVFGVVWLLSRWIRARKPPTVLLVDEAAPGKPAPRRATS